MDFIFSIFFILMMIIFSGVFRTLVSKSARKRLDQNPDSEANDQLTYNDNTNYEKEVKQEEVKKSDLIGMFQEYYLKKKNEIYGKDTYVNRNTLSLDKKEKEEERKKVKEEIIHKRKSDKKENFKSYKRETLNSLSKEIDGNSISMSLAKKPALKRIKKLSYFKQAIVLSEILGPPKGLDL